MNDISAKIQSMEQRLKNQETKPPLMRKSNNSARQTSEFLTKIPTFAKSSVYTQEELRNSWDHGVQFKFKKDSENAENLTEPNEAFRMSLDINFDSVSKNILKHAKSAKKVKNQTS